MEAARKAKFQAQVERQDAGIALGKLEQVAAKLRETQVRGGGWFRGRRARAFVHACLPASSCVCVDEAGRAAWQLPAKRATARPGRRGRGLAGLACARRRPSHTPPPLPPRRAACGIQEGAARELVDAQARLREEAAAAEKLRGAVEHWRQVRGAGGGAGAGGEVAAPV